jgi:hypothetical protein
VCEAYFSDEKTWYAALITSVNEVSQDVEIQWIGYKSSEKLPKKYINPLTAPNPDDLFEGALCNAVNTVDGMWYPCTVEKVISDSISDVSQDLSGMLFKYKVRFPHLATGGKVTVPLDYIRITKDQMVKNEKKREVLQHGDMTVTSLADF